MSHGFIASPSVGWFAVTQLAGQVTYDLDLAGTWWCAWETSKDGIPRVDVHPMEADQHGEVLYLDAERALPVSEGSYQWRGELRLWDNEALIGWYRSTDAAVRSKGALYLALHPQGTFAWGRWVGMSYDVAGKPSKELPPGTERSILRQAGITWRAQ